MPTPVESPGSSRVETGDPSSEAPSPSAFARELGENLRAIGGYLAIYAETHLDRGRLALKNGLLSLVITLLILFVVSGAVIVATALLLYGLALGVAELTGGRAWIGFSAIGALVLIIAWFAIGYAVAKLKASSLHRRMEEYETRLQRQREKRDSRTFDDEKKPTAQ